MSTAIKGAALIGGALALGATAFLLASTGVGFAALPFLLEGSAALGLGGLGMETAAIAQALTSNRGANITIRQAAGYRQIVYGTQRVGATMIYLSTTGGNHDQVNYVHVIAAHPCDSIVNLYLDGRQVFWEVGSVGNADGPGGVNFGGHADRNDHTGPDGSTYNFGGIVYCEACYGTQTNQPNTTPNGGYNTGLHANDPTWAPTADGVPYVGGCTYTYFKYVYNAAMFPQPPEVRYTVRGKNDIWDPRTQSRGYTSNCALIVADVFTGSKLLCGLEDYSVNQAQLIAAANICDEQVPYVGGGTGYENRYACHYHYDTSKGPGAAISEMISAMGGRFTRSGGEWYLWPAAWIGPSFEWNADHLAADFVWNPTRDRRDLVNRLTGTYTAPNYPYNATTENGSSLYDANGFYDGTIQNNFGFAFQAASIPYYAEDALHGYASNQWLNEDGGELLQRDVPLPCVLSISQAQRLLKIALRRNRMQGSAVLTMFPAAFEMAQLDVMRFSFEHPLGWDEKMLEVTSVALGAVKGPNGVMVPQVRVGVQETAASVYDWSTSEELTQLVAEAAPQLNWIPAAPTNLTATSSAATAVVGLDGIVHPRVELAWDTPQDGLTQQIQYGVQGPVVTGSTVPGWLDLGTVPVTANSVLVANVVAGQAYNFRIRGVRANGATSAWVELDGVTVSITLSVLGNLGVGVGSLVGEVDGTGADILCMPFTAQVGAASVAVLPAGYTLTGLTQGQLWYVYYDDPTFAGGAVTPVGTQLRSDWENKPGRFLIDSLVTPSGSGTGGSSGAIYRPTMPHDIGSQTTQSPYNAFDSDPASYATLSARANSLGATNADLVIQGWPSIALSYAATLSVVIPACTFAPVGGDSNVSVTVTLGAGTPVGAVLAAGAQTFTFAVPASTPLGSISVEITPFAATYSSGSGAALPGQAMVQVADVFIQ